MGLDYVELVMAVEEAFEIEIEDEAYQSVETVGDLHELVLVRLAARRDEARDPVACARVPAFNRIRRALIEVAGVERRDVRPAAALDELVPREGRRAAWEKLRDQSRLRWPGLTAPAWLLWITLAASVTACAAAYVFYSLTWSLILVFGGCFLLILNATRALQVELPGGVSTVGDLTQTVARWNYGLLVSGREPASPDEVWKLLVEIIEEQLAIPRSEIRPEASFVRDLQVD